MSEKELHDIRAIESLVTKGYMAAVHSKDPSQYAALFTQDSMWMPSESVPVVGRSAIEAAERQIFAAVSLQITSTVIEANASGDIGWALGQIDGTAVSHGSSESTPFYLRLMWIVKRENHSWKIHRQIWHTRPPAEGGA